jgi:hypothetical protein
VTGKIYVGLKALVSGELFTKSGIGVVVRLGLHVEPVKQEILRYA